MERRQGEDLLIVEEIADIASQACSQLQLEDVEARE
jgi:hypothetical protein